MRKGVAILIACLIIAGASLLSYAFYRVLTSKTTPQIKLCGKLEGGKIVLTVISSRKVDFQDLSFSVKINGKKENCKVYGPIGALIPGDEIEIFLPPMNPRERVNVTVTAKDIGVVFSKDFIVPSPPRAEFSMLYVPPGQIVLKALNYSGVRASDLEYFVYVSGVLQEKGIFEETGKLEKGEEFLIPVNATYGQEIEVKLLYLPENVWIYSSSYPLPPGTFRAKLSFQHSGNLFTFYLNVTSVYGNISWQDLSFDVYLNGKYLYPTQYMLSLNGKPKIYGKVSEGDSLGFTLNASFGDTFSVKVKYKPTGFLLYSGSFQLPPYLEIEVQRGCLRAGYFNFTVLHVKGEADWSNFTFMCQVNGIKVPVKVEVNGHGLFGKISAGDFVSIKLPCIPSEKIQIRMTMTYKPTNTVYFTMIWGGSS